MSITSFKTSHPDIPWKQIAGMRDVLIHEYFNVDLFLTWKVVKHELPEVKKKLTGILAENKGSYLSLSKY